MSINKYNFLDFAEEVLKSAQKPLTFQEVWSIGQENGLSSKLSIAGKTPWQTLGARLFVDVRDNPETKFMMASFLNSTKPRTRRPFVFTPLRLRNELIGATTESITFKLSQTHHGRMKVIWLHAQFSNRMIYYQSLNVFQHLSASALSFQTWMTSTPLLYFSLPNQKTTQIGRR